MHKTLYTKFIIAYAIFGIFGFVVVATIVSSLFTDALIRKEADSLYKEAIIIADTFAADLYNSEASLESVQLELKNLGVYLDSQIWIINPSGLIVVDSTKEVDLDNQVKIENFDSTIGGNNYYTIGTFFNSFDENKLSVIAPITDNFMVKGYVVIHESEKNIISFKDSLLNISYLELVILFLLSLIILLFFTEIVYLPLRKITKATEEYASGNLHYNLQIDSEDEMGYLGASLSYMAGELAQGEDVQKRLVANVSHDFRSPLTSIKGYSEAMMDGTIPPEMHEKYLAIVANESDRLIKLTNSLLTLNNLNTDGMVLDKTNFDVNDVIRKTIGTFEVLCREKRISLQVILTGNELYVSADKQKIQQVLYNLLDNAIKFSHKDSVIKLETKEKHNKVYISVKDQGIGIPKESINQIWDRFYKTDLSRGKDKKGTGLGLSITREIIRAHGENINVVSTEGEGTEFIFTLSIVEVEGEED